MPTYRYRCAKCADELEVWQSFSDKPLSRHNGGCGGKLAKVIEPGRHRAQGIGLLQDGQPQVERVPLGQGLRLVVGVERLGVEERLGLLELELVGLQFVELRVEAARTPAPRALRSRRRAPRAPEPARRRPDTSPTPPQHLPPTPSPAERRASARPVPGWGIPCSTVLLVPCCSGARRPSSRSAPAPSSPPTWARCTATPTSSGPSRVPSSPRHDLAIGAHGDARRPAGPADPPVPAPHRRADLDRDGARTGDRLARPARRIRDRAQPGPPRPHRHRRCAPAGHPGLAPRRGRRGPARAPEPPSTCSPPTARAPPTRASTPAVRARAVRARPRRVVVAAGVLVLATDENGRSAGGGPALGVTLLVSPRQARDLAAAAAGGTVTIALGPTRGRSRPGPVTQYPAPACGPSSSSSSTTAG